MDIADCYHLLELKSGATLVEIKASYRRLARQYHPDINPSNAAKEKFIALSDAYKLLLSTVQPSLERSVESQEKVTQSAKTKVTRKDPYPQSPPLSVAEQKLKNDYHQQLQQLWKYKKFVKAIALVEALAQRLPYDLEVKSWQAIAYQRYGSQLVDQRQLDKARIFLKKALNTDPHNRQLWSEVERDFRRLERLW
ncbi:J domain-containing protein [Aliterella atlantica]|uniref:Molecular chaperone DnaJ n=1 Tax=Aliterella atlantica CENA595 TaxID=1618023 RepID=A0A0D8ZXE7_9CYAN|nr:J domain-containing protein [Aliterella atlantica]KJH73435.1 molecular chaperone DnaJ [Aliterella atlantica CENA595]